LMEDPEKYGIWGGKVPSFDHPEGPCHLCA